MQTNFKTKGDLVTPRMMAGIEDGPPASEDEGEDGAQLQLALPVRPLVPRVDAKRRHDPRCGIKVYFDNCSHQSGQRRAYIKCSSTVHHAEQFCVRYTFVHMYDSELDCMAFLGSWLLDGAPATKSREGHKYFYPSSGQLAATKALLQL